MSLNLRALFDSQALCFAAICWNAVELTVSTEMCLVPQQTYFNLVYIDLFFMVHWLRFMTLA